MKRSDPPSQPKTTKIQSSKQPNKQVQSFFESSEEEQPKESYFQEEERLLREEGGYIESDDDEYYDLTIKKNQKNINGLSYNELIEEISTVTYQIEKLKTQNTMESDDEDCLEKYFRENEIKLSVNKDHSSLVKELQQLRSALSSKIPLNMSVNEVDKIIENKVNVKLLAHSITATKRNPTIDQALDEKRIVKDIKPIEGQKGDGRTNLNDKYGY
ncbi:hypothetical protein QTN25_005306 [Entamoeba marina]